MAALSPTQGVNAVAGWPFSILKGLPLQVIESQSPQKIFFSFIKGKCIIMLNNASLRDGYENCALNGKDYSAHECATKVIYGIY